MKSGLLRRNWNARDLGRLLIGGLAILDVSAGRREYHLIHWRIKGHSCWLTPNKWHISKFGWNRLMSIVPVTNIKGVSRVLA
jgi:hypothetical protein